MDFANRGNRPTQTPQGQNNEQSSPAFQPPAKKEKGMNLGKLSSLFMLVAGAILLLALVVGLVFMGDGSNANKEADLINTDKYQAVFLDSQDGQVYFGKLEVYNGHLYRLTDIYYVRVETPIQPEGTETQAQPNISLAKLGNELHGPEDVMLISRDKVLYWENLKDDGQVVTAIKEYQANGGQATQQQQQQVPTNGSDAGAAGGTQPAGTEPQDDTSGDAETQTP